MIAEIRLKQFRSYEDQLFTLNKGINIVVGPNASGKTNLLEALVVACQGSSYRTTDTELIKHNHSWARIDTLNDKQETRTVKLFITNKLNKEFVLGHKAYKRLTLINQLPVVLFEPNQLLMLSGSPETRRNYLDEILEQTQPGYKKLKNDYLRTLRQLNTLLKNSGSSNDLFPWDVRLSRLGGLIANARAELVAILNKQITQVYRHIAKGNTVISLNYTPLVKIDQYESLMMKRLELNRELDRLRGFTTSGPHREDMKILIDQKTVDAVASRGENRSLTIALKMLEADIIKQKTQLQPIVLLDDVFSELDENRRASLIESLINYQVLITTTEADSIKHIKAKIINTQQKNN